jgi:hypothetical protein
VVVVVAAAAAALALSQMRTCAHKYIVLYTMQSVSYTREYCIRVICDAVQLHSLVLDSVRRLPQLVCCRSTTQSVALERSCILQLACQHEVYTNTHATTLASTTNTFDEYYAINTSEKWLYDQHLHCVRLEFERVISS